MNQLDDADFIFVIDTDQYSGNFEREMCAYVTGAVGECRVGNKEADLFKEEVNDDQLTDKTLWVADDDSPCYRPASPWPSPGRHNDGHGRHFDDTVETDGHKWPAYESVAIFFCEKPTAEDIASMKERAYKYVQYAYDTRRDYQMHVPKINIKGFRLIAQTKVVEMREVLVAGPSTTESV